MKRILCLALAIALMVSTGCNSKSPSSTDKVDSGSNNASSTITESNDASLGDNNSDKSEVDNILTFPTRREDRASLQTSSEENTTVTVRPGYALEDAPKFEKIKFGKYEYVWGDEFDGNTIDSNKWESGLHGLGRDGGSKIQLMTEKEDSSIMGVRNGTLQLNARRHVSLTNPDVEIASFYSIHTQNTMNFRYGYIEMRAKVPHSRGLINAFWFKNEAIGLVTPIQDDYFVEFDAFETWCSESQVDPGLHKWYRKGSNYYHTQPAQIGGYGKYFFQDIENIRNEYHTYAMEWTPEFIKYYVDGEVYCTYDIVTEFDKNYKVDIDGKELPAGIGSMAGFHDYIYPIVTTMYNFDPQSSFRQNCHLTDDTEMPFEYWIDYIRLYQDPNVDSGLVTKK